MSGGCLVSVNTKIENAYGSLGRALGTRPMIPFFTCVVVGAALIGAMLGTGLKTDLDITNSLIAYNSPFRPQQKFKDDDYSEGYSRTEYMSSFAKDGSSVATPKAVAEYAAAQIALQSVSFTDVDGVEWTKEKLCARTTAPPSTDGLFEAAFIEYSTDRAYGLPCSRYSVIDCFYDGKYDYYKGIPQFLTFPWTKPNGDTATALIPFNNLPLPNGFVNSTGQPAKPTIASMQSDQQVLDLLSPSCKVWAGVRLPPEIIMGGTERDADGKLTAVKTFLLVLGIMDVPALAKDLQFRDCASTCLAGVRQYFGSCAANLPSNPSIVTTCLGVSGAMLGGCKATCLKRPDDTWRAKAEAILLGWEDAYLTALEAQDAAAAADDSKILRYHWVAGRSAGDVLKSAVSGDLPLIIIGYVVAFAYSVLVLCRWHARWSKALVMCGGILLLLLSIGSSFAIAQFIGLKLSIQIIQVLPFLTIGLGLTDIFVMMYTFQYHPELDDGQLASDTLRQTGPAHLMVASTSMLVFGIGASVNLPIVATFSEAALLTIVITYLMVTFGFLPILVLDAQRIRKQRSDCLPCFSHQLDPTMKAEREPRDRLKAAKRCAGLMEMMPVKVAILVGFAALLALSCLNISTLNTTKKGLPTAEFLPKGSYVSAFYGDLQKFYTTYPHSLVSGLDKNGEYVKMDYPNALYDMMILNKQLLDNVDDIDQNFKFESGWVHSYWLWANANNNGSAPAQPDCAFPTSCVNLIDPTQCYPGSTFGINITTCKPAVAPFYQTYIPGVVNVTAARPQSGLIAWLNGPGAPSSGQFNFSADGTIRSTSQGWLAKDMYSEEKWIKLIRQFRGVTDASPLPMYGSGWAFTFYEADLPLHDESDSALGFCVLAIALGILVFILHPGAAIIMTAHVVMMMAEVFGLMNTMNIQLNAVSLCNVIMGTAIGVTFTGYIARGFMRVTAEVPPQADPSAIRPPMSDRQNRATNAYLANGPPVLHGAIGVFVCIITLSVTKLPYFAVYFFNMYVLIVFIGIGNGLVLLPTVLSLIGPETYGAQSSTVTKYQPNTDDTAKGNGNGANNGTKAEEVVQMVPGDAAADSSNPQ